jgi:hypothetical protein
MICHSAFYYIFNKLFTTGRLVIYPGYVLIKIHPNFNGLANLCWFIAVVEGMTIPFYRTYAVALLLTYIGFGDTYGKGSFPTHFGYLSLPYFAIQ